VAGVGAQPACPGVGESAHPGAVSARIMPIVDVSDPSNPNHLLNWQFPGDGRPHDTYFSEDGTRLYAAQPGQFGDTGSSIGPNGLVILDVSDIQFRLPNPQIRVISTLFWTDGGQAQMARPVTYHGRPHLIFTDEAGAGGVGGRQGACDRGLPPSGFARIIDISDETNPKTISKLMLEVHDPANCPSVLTDPPANNYSSHYCDVDKARNPKMVACTYRDGGLRVFDIKDPYHPKEIAYYKPPGAADGVPSRINFVGAGTRPNRRPHAYPNPLAQAQGRDPALVRQPGQRLSDRAVHQRGPEGQAERARRG
jgi:hypothetical protein